MGPIHMNNNIMSAMMILILFSISALSISNAMVLDTDGDPLLNGGKYYIRPVDISVNGGLTITSPCPYYITRSKDETFPGIPATISSPFKLAFINPGLPISITFDSRIDTCMQSFKWQVISDESTGKSYVRTGGIIGWKPDFSILIGNAPKSYKINYIPIDEGDVGFFEKDGLLLGVNTGTPLDVVFVKAGFNGIAMKL